MSEVFFYQILPHYAKREQLDSGFLVLDNSSAERPDWFEYWPIRKFLLSEALDENSFYGFLSPKFKEKTNLSSAAAIAFVKKESAADVVILTPSIHLTAYYLNVFTYGEYCHPGLLDVAGQLFDRIGSPTALNELVTNSQNEVYSNYLAAKPRFWRAWLRIAEQLIAIAESPTDPLGAELRKMTPYRDGAVEMKIFILERIPTWLLSRDSTFLARTRDPFVARPAQGYKLPGAIACDALKIAYATSGRKAFKDTFLLISKLGKLLSWMIRAGGFFGSQNVRSALAIFSSNWTKAGRS